MDGEEEQRRCPLFVRLGMDKKKKKIYNLLDMILTAEQTYKTPLFLTIHAPNMKAETFPFPWQGHLDFDMQAENNSDLRV